MGRRRPNQVRNIGCFLGFWDMNSEGGEYPASERQVGFWNILGIDPEYFLIEGHTKKTGIVDAVKRMLIAGGTVGIQLPGYLSQIPARKKSWRKAPKFPVT